MSKVSFKNKLFYGFGAIGVSVSDAFIGSFLTLYVTDVLKLDALLFASLLIGPKIFDIVIDIFVMYFVGKTKTKFGMYKPWLLNIIPLCATMVLMFSTPYFNLSTGWILAILVITYFFSTALCDSFMWIPYTAIPGVMTEDEGELVKISSYKSLFENISYTLVSIITMPILLAFGSHKNPQGWLLLAGIFAGICLIFTLITFFGLKTDLSLEEKFTRGYSVKDTVIDYKNIITNKKFLFLSLLFAFVYFSNYLISAVSYYFYIYNLNMENQITYLAILATVITIITSFVSPLLYKKFNFKVSFVIGASCAIIGSLLMMLSYSPITMYISTIFRAFGTISLLTYIFSIWPNVAKNMNPDKVKSPLNNVMGLSNIIGNLSALLGSTLGAAIISLSKYDSTLPTQSDFTLSIIRYISPIVSIVILSLFILFVLIGFKKIDKK